MCATSWCDLDLTFDLAVVTLTYKILFRLYLRNLYLYLSTGISNTILSLISFYLNLGCCTFGCLLM